MQMNKKIPKLEINQLKTNQGYG